MGVNRFAVWGVLFLLVIPVSMGLTRWLRQPQLFPGDKLEYRTCRECGGSGVEAGDASEGPQEGPGAPGSRCVGCGGKKQVAVILPGPNHPSKVSGVIFEGKADDPDQDLAVMMSAADPHASVPGALADAHVVFQKDAERREYTSNQKGVFKGALSPGEWKFTATAGGFKEQTGTLSVPALTEPIWQEEAHIVRPDESRIGTPCVISMHR